MVGRHSIRIPVHGFIELDDWEWDIVNHPVFQRLRRIRQLAFSEHIYPGSTHTRFEHSLGVLHVATKMFDVLQRKHGALMGEQLRFDNELLQRGRRLVRLAALLHDVGHAPLSHSGEDLMPVVNGKRVDHEDYSGMLIAESMKDVIDNHRLNQERLHITGREVASFYMGKPDVSANLLIFRDIVSGQLDADRMDYLLRDSHHCGVTYGFYDIDRILDTLVFVQVAENDAPGLKIAIEPGGRHAAEGMILARYFMFEQVYFQKTRMAYDHHGAACLKEAIKPDGTLPDPHTEVGRKKYLKMDDWFLFEHIRSSNSLDALAILQHMHDRRVRETSEVADEKELREHEEVMKMLQEKGMDAWSADASKSWYKSGSSEIFIATDSSHAAFSRGRPLTKVSETAGKIRDSKQRRIYVPLGKKNDAAALIGQKGDGHGLA
jgi:HD superfamily phosphohydrolase